MSRMKDYFEFSQLLHWLSDEALNILLETEQDDYRAKIIQNELEKRGHAWHLNEPFKAPADDFQVARLLAVREAQSSASYTPDLARYELAQPRALITSES